MYVGAHRIKTIKKKKNRKGGHKKFHSVYIKNELCITINIRNCYTDC
jgi:hypothetical protein